MIRAWTLAVLLTLPACAEVVRNEGMACVEPIDGEWVVTHRYDSCYYVGASDHSCQARLDGDTLEVESRLVIEGRGDPDSMSGDDCLFWTAATCGTFDLEGGDYYLSFVGPRDDFSVPDSAGACSIPTWDLEAYGYDI